MLGAPGALGMPGKETSSTDNPHFLHSVASGSLSVPQFGHLIGKDTPDGLKHISSPWSALDTGPFVARVFAACAERPLPGNFESDSLLIRCVHCMKSTSSCTYRLPPKNGGILWKLFHQQRRSKCLSSLGNVNNSALLDRTDERGDTHGKTRREMRGNHRSDVGTRRGDGNHVRQGRREGRLHRAQPGER